jgi:hypothetical protein
MDGKRAVNLGANEEAKCSCSYSFSMALWLLAPALCDEFLRFLIFQFFHTIAL